MLESPSIAAELSFQGRSRERHHCLDQALLARGHLIVLVQGGLYILAELKPRELPLDLVERVHQRAEH